MYLHLSAVGVEVDLGVLSTSGANNLLAAFEKAQQFIAFRTSYLGHNTPPLLITMAYQPIVTVVPPAAFCVSS